MTQTLKRVKDFDYPVFTGGHFPTCLCQTTKVETQQNSLVRVGIVEDDPVLREALGQMIESVPSFQLLGTAATVKAGRALLSKHPDVVLMDLALPDGNGLELISSVQDTEPPIRIVVLTVFADVRSVVGAIEQGADGYLLKDSNIDQIVRAIDVVLSGGAPLSPAVAGHILAKVRTGAGKKAAKPTITLTPKELEVLEAIAAGRALKEVAAALSISTHTVGDHVKAIYRKLSVNSRSEAVFKAVQEGIISLDVKK